MNFSKFHLPWQHTPDEDAARAEAERRKQEIEQLTLQRRQEEQIRQTNDFRELSRGGLPSQAVSRLKEIGETGSGIFTSDLAPEEAGLLRREGFRPIGMVTGSAMYHVGQAYASIYNDCEVNVLSDAYNIATKLAVARMRQELKLINGHGVVGVRLNLVRHEWADKTVEVQVIGTAVEGPGIPPKNPWLCDLSGQEWYMLHRAGYQPAGLVWGHCTWFVLTTYADEMTKQTWSNVEMTHWSTALSSARHVALKHVRGQAKEQDATGVAGVKIVHRLDEVHLTGGEGDVYEREHHNLVLSVIGTAIKAIPHMPIPRVAATIDVLSLLDGRISPVGIGAMDAVVE